jgi:Phage terminase large subunit
MNEEILKFSELAKFLPKQKEAQEASKRFKFTLYGGSLGSGKSYWLRWMMVYWLIKLYAKTGQKGIRAGLFCEDYPSLNDRHLSKVKYEFPAWLGRYNQQFHEFTLAPEYGSGVIAFRNLDDPEKYLSVEFAVMGVDEINRNQVVTFRELRKRLRWAGIKDVRFLAACNPIGEAWVKNWWVKRMFPPEENEQYEFVFVPALPTDNPYLDASYYKSLESLPENQRKAFLEGNWDAFDEGMDERGYLRLLSDRELQASYVQSGVHSGYNILGIDPAAGGDNSAIVHKSGNLQEVIFNQKLQDTMDLVGVIMDKARERKADMLVIDRTGVGQGVFDRLKQLDYSVKGVSFGERSEDDMFANLKAEWHWRERQWLLSGGRLIANLGWNEFEYVKYKNKDGKIAIQPKEDLFKEGLLSPNCVDAAVLIQCVNDTAIRSARMVKQRGGAPIADRTIEIWRGN